jgi:hypothetical protein
MNAIFLMALSFIEGSYSNSMHLFHYLTHRVIAHEGDDNLALKIYNFIGDEYDFESRKRKV